jgi:CysZ protein
MEPNTTRTPGLTDAPFFARFANGFLAPFQGARYLFQHPALLKYALPPALLTALTLFALTALVFGTTSDLVNALWTRPDAATWASQYLLLPLWYLLYASLLITLTLLGTGLGYLASLPLAGPFNELLSEKIEAIETGFEAPFHLPILLRNLLVTVLHLLAFSALQLLAWGLAALLNLIPALGQILAASITFLTSPLLVGFVPFDYPMTLRLWRFSEKLRFMRRHFALFWGFSAASFLFLYIPFLNLLFLPACVTAATLLTLKMEASGELNTPDRRKALLQKQPPNTPQATLPQPSAEPRTQPAQEAVAYEERR